VSTAPLITRVEPLRPRGLKVRLHLEDEEEPIEIMLEALERQRLGVGDELPPDKRQRLLNDDADIRVRDAAFNLLSYRARTRTELSRKLRQKGFWKSRIEPCLDRLEEKGFLDDGAVAEAFVRDRLLHRPKGKAALSSELRAKGVDGDLATQSIDRVFENAELDDNSLACDVARMWVARQGAGILTALVSDRRTPEREKAHRRLHGYLSRRGFRGAALGEGIAAAREAARDRE
jgi:regulatory protein